MARALALFAGDWPVVIPSGSCAGMFRHHYFELFKDRPETLQQVASLSARTFELAEFLLEVCKVRFEHTGAPLKLALHTSRSARREMNTHLHGRALARLAAGSSASSTTTRASAAASAAASACACPRSGRHGAGQDRRAEAFWRGRGGERGPWLPAQHQRLLREAGRHASGASTWRARCAARLREHGRGAMSHVADTAATDRLHPQRARGARRRAVRATAAPWMR